MKGREIAQVVNELRDIAVRYAHTQQLREQIHAVIVPVLLGQEHDKEFLRGKVAGLQDTIADLERVNRTNRQLAFERDEYILELEKKYNSEPRLVSYAPDHSTCTLSVNGREFYYNKVGESE